MFKLNQIVLALLIAILGFSVRASADAPTYSVSVGGGSLIPSPICGDMTAKATLTGSLNVQNSSTEIQESGDRWSWSASITGFKSTSSASYGPVPTGVQLPEIKPPHASSGSATCVVTATAYNTTTPVTWPGYYLITVTASDNFTLTDSGTDPATVTTPTKSGMTTLEIVVVVVDRIQYNDAQNGWTNVPSPLYILTGQSVAFKALPSPADASFPSGYPVWGGTSGASGTGNTTTVHFSALSASTSDSKTITATCVNSIKSAGAVVFDLIPLAIPIDTSVPNHHPTHIGIAEKINLSYTVIPSGLSQSQIGSPSWAIDGGGDILSTNPYQYQAGLTAGGTTFTLKITVGPSATGSRSFKELIVAPTLAYQINRGKSSGIFAYHDNNTASIGFLGYVCVSPNNVSFKYVETRETDCTPTTATGCLSTLAHSYHMGGANPIEAPWNPLFFDNVSYVNTWRIGAWDNVGFGPIPPDFTKYPSTGYGPGSISYQIPYTFHASNGTSGVYSVPSLINSILHTGKVDADGTASETKAAVSVSAAANDPYVGPFPGPPPAYAQPPYPRQLW